MGRSSRDGVGEGRQQYALAPMVGGTVGEMDLVDLRVRVMCRCDGDYEWL